MDMDTVEGRQAYIEKCELEMRELHGRAAVERAQYEAFNLALQAHLAFYNAQIATLIYRGMFDPTFCQPRS